jgi:plastocyanin
MPRPLLILLIASAPIVAAPPADGVVIQGTITYTGPLPRPIEVIEAMAKRHLVERDPKTNALKDAVVWIEGAKVPGKRPAKEAAYVDQQNFFFVPHVLAVEGGQEVEFANGDSANHGVRSGCADGRNCFNTITPPGKSHRVRFFASKDPVRIDCPLHATMAAWVYVFDHPWFSVTKADGAFKLPAIPPGNYTLHVRHPSGGMVRKQALVVEEGEPQPLSIEFGKDDLKVK